MTQTTINLPIPIELYQQLGNLADQEKTDLITLLAKLVNQAEQRQTWLRQLKLLQQQIHQAGGLAIAETEAEALQQLRQTRLDIFNAEYAHLY